MSYRRKMRRRAFVERMYFSAGFRTVAFINRATFSWWLTRKPQSVFFGNLSDAITKR